MEPEPDFVDMVAAGELHPSCSPNAEKLWNKVRFNFTHTNPYTRLTRKGTFFTPVEAGVADDHSDTEDFSSLGSPRDSPVTSESCSMEGREAALYRSASGKEVHSRDILHVQIHPDDFACAKHCGKDGKLKLRRPVPQIRASELLSGLAKNIDGDWIFEGQLNGWPAFTNYCLKSLTSLSGYKVFKRVNRIWSAKDGKPLPDVKALSKGVRATFVAPPWSSSGWAHGSPGFVFWYSTQHGVPRCLFGEGMLQRLQADKDADSCATLVHTFAHRYPAAKESLEDRNTWHVGIFIEWGHQRFGTIAELAWRNGVGGYGGRANWVPDKLEPETQLLRTLAPGLIRPWSTTVTEIRMYDIDCKDKAEFEAFLIEHSEKQKPLEEQRFLEPKIAMSAPVRLRRCDSAALAEHFLNYASRVQEYDKLRQNCQTFAADAYAFLTGTKDIRCFHQMLMVGYQQRTMSFLYAPRYED